MASREEYNACMRPYLTGSKPKEQRKLDFCVGAKVCSGHAATEEEAIQVCSLPKPPKESKEPGEPKVRRTRRVKTCIPCLSEGIKEVLRKTVGPELTDMIDETETCLPGVVLELCPKGVK